MRKIHTVPKMAGKKLIELWISKSISLITRKDLLHIVY